MIPGGPELHDALFVALAVVHVGVGDIQRHPESAARVGRCGADGRAHDGNLSIGRLPPRPRGRAVPHVVVQFGSFDVTLEHQPAGRVVPAERRHAGHEDEIEPALGIDHDEPAVEGEVRDRSPARVLWRAAHRTCAPTRRRRRARSRAIRFRAGSRRSNARCTRATRAHSSRARRRSRARLRGPAARSPRGATRSR